MISIIFASILDFFLGDPYNFPHPVKLMGKVISFEEKIARRFFHNWLKFTGLLILIINLLLGLFIPYYILKFLRPYDLFYYIVNIYLLYTSLAAKSLDFEASKVKEALNIGIEEARKRVSYIVGRDTDDLNREEIIKATVETVSENTSDGIVGPLFFAVLWGAPGAIMYKFANTMDSMLGYMDDKYIDIGYFPAKVDDILNFIPARLTALLMILSSIGKFDWRRGFKILKRDRLNHKSPNSGYPESATAGLLGIEIGGDSIYHGLLVKKPSMGDGSREVDLKDIENSIRIMYRTELVFLTLYTLINIISLI